MKPAACALLLVLFLTGCARYEYQLVEPAQFTGHIGSQADYVATLDPLEYRFRSVSNHLVIQIFNPTEETIQLRGSESYVVDLNGQSHPLRSLSIAPHSYGKVIVPPPRPVVQETGPTIGFGVGTSIGMRDDRRALDRDEFVDRPRYLAVYDEEDSYYWDISGEGALRMRLTYQRKEKAFSDDFLIRRVMV
jgi:hypothetical protein